MLGAWQADTTVRGAAGPATLPACSVVGGWRLSVSVHSSLGWRFLSLQGGGARDVSLIAWKALEQAEQGATHLCPVRAGHWAGHAGSASLQETNPLPGLLCPRLGEQPPDLNTPWGPRTPKKESWVSGWEKRVSICPYQRWLSLGHPSLGGSRLDHTGDIAGYQ